MKKFFNLLSMFLALVIVSCNPMEDIHDEIDAELDSQLAVAEADYVLTEDDYEELGQSFPNFSSLEDARTLIPALLSDLYPTYGAGSILNVGFDLYDPLRVTDYEMTASDYALIELDNEYFTGMGEITDFLEAKYPQAEEGSYVRLTYDITADEIVYELDADDYDLIGEELEDVYPDPAPNAAQYNTFEIREDRDSYWSMDMIIEALGVVIEENYGAVAGQLYNITYATYNGSRAEETIKLRFDGNTFAAVDTGVSYELDSDDYQYIAAELSEEYPEATASMAEYGNFEKRTSVYWEDEMIEEALNILLMREYPDAEDGDMFEVTYDVYDGEDKTETMSMIKSGDEFVINEGASVSTIEATNVFAFTNGDWNEPYMLPADSYTEEFGQSFSNFGDEEEALTKIAIFLGREFPYAEEGEFKAVAYRFYNGEATVTEYANFVLEGGEWSAIPSVISDSLQFGYEDGMWVPDNTINYSLGAADYAIIADALSGNDELSTQIASMERYSNFDRRPGASAYWDDDAILLAMQSLLNEIAPNAEEGQKYVLTFDIYNGSNTTESLSLIKEGGEWVVNE
jgi:hypothetical protein